MLTVNKVGGSDNRAIAEFIGNADDIATLQLEYVPNGSLFTVIEQNKTYMFDKEHTRWYLHSTGGGGSYSGLSIYLWTSGSTYAVDDLVIKDNLMYICTVANSDVEWNSNHWSAINSTDGNYAIVDSVSDLPTFGADDRKIYFVEDEGIFYYWDGTEWNGLTTSVETITIQEVDDLFN